MLQLERVAEAPQLVVAHDVAFALQVDAVVVGVRPAVVRVHGRPAEAAFEQVVADVEVLLVGFGADAERHVAHVHAAHDVALRAVALEAERPRGVAQGQGLEVDVAAVHLEHVATLAAAPVEDGAVAARAADDDRVIRGAAGIDREGARVHPVGELEHLSGLRRAERGLQGSRVRDRHRHRGSGLGARHGASGAAHGQRLVGPVRIEGV